jgi:membrane protease subunit (stomatin/prohibitin family)
VYFVTTRELAGHKFGGKVGKVRDPQSGLPVELMVNGSFSFKVVDPQKLVIGLVGLQRTSNEEFLAWFKDQVLKTIKDDIAELCVKKKWPLLDVTSGAYTEEIERDVLAGLGEHVKSYGLAIARLGNFVIDIDDADATNLKKLYTDAAYLRTVGGVGNFQQFAAGKAMLGAGEGMAKGGGAGGEGNAMLGGAGLAVGMGMAQMMTGANRPASGGGTTAVGVVCPACGANVAPGKFCSSCGKELAVPAPAAAAFCAGCGGALAADAKFCGQCGRKR